MSDALPLPPRPNLDQYKKLAKDFHDACRSSDPGAVRQWSARWVETLARLQGRGISPPVQKEIAREAERVERRWRKLTESNARVRCSLTGAQFFLAREHGFTSWPKFARHVQGLTTEQSPVATYEAAADAIVNGDAAALRQLLREHPGLARARSTRDHRSTLLHYVSANGVEDFRQKTPPNIVEIANMLLDADADVNAESDAYGGGSTTLGLVATSLHPAQAGVQIALMETLLARGARLDDPSAAGNGHTLIGGCLANGQPEAAGFFADRGAPLDLEGAAALGRLPIVQTYFDDRGVLRSTATRGQMESAFLYACGYGRAEVAEYLIERGVDPGVRNSDGQTGLHWAAYGGHIEVFRVLLRHGAPVDVREKNYRAQPLDMALWAWHNSPDPDERERSYEAVALLAQAGARFDSEQWHDPQAEGPGMLEKIAADPRMKAALRGEIR